MRQHTPPQHDSVAQHDTAAATRQQRCTSPPTTHSRKREQNNTRRAEQYEGAVPNPNTGTTHTHHSRHSTGPPRKRKGDTNTQTGDANIRRGVSNTAALHSPCHPPSTMPPHHSQWPHPPPRRGESGRRIPHHTNTTDTHPHPHHTTHPEKNNARHDSSTRQHCNGMSRARATPPHRAGQQQHTPPPFHTPRRMDTIHSSTHLLSLTHVHTTDDQR